MRVTTDLPDARQFLIGERHLVRAPTRAHRGFYIGADRRFVDPFAMRGEPKKRAQYAKPFPLRPCPELEARVKLVGVARCELIEHHVAAIVSKGGQLLRERPVFAQRGWREIRALAIRQKNDARLCNRDAR